jgi:YgiT-type zinc finger domain-containing protein
MMEMTKCPSCNVEYEEVETNFEHEDIVLRNVKTTRCPKCGRELFTPEQYRLIKERLESVAPPLKLRRHISVAGKRPVIYLPEDVVRALRAKVGDEVDIYVEGNKIVIEKTA